MPPFADGARDIADAAVDHLSWPRIDRRHRHGGAARRREAAMDACSSPPRRARLEGTSSNTRPPPAAAPRTCRGRGRLPTSKCRPCAIDTARRRRRLSRPIAARDRADARWRSPRPRAESRQPVPAAAVPAARSDERSTNRWASRLIAPSPLPGVPGGRVAVARHAVDVRHAAAAIERQDLDAGAVARRSRPDEHSPLAAVPQHVGRQFGHDDCDRPVSLVVQAGARRRPAPPCLGDLALLRTGDEDSMMLFPPRDGDCACPRPASIDREFVAQPLRTAKAEPQARRRW